MKYYRKYKFLFASSLLVSLTFAPTVSDADRIIIYKPSVVSLSATASTSELADGLTAAILKPGIANNCLAGAEFDGVDSQGVVFDNATPLQGFPTDGNSYAVLSSGPADLAPGVATTFASNSLGGVIIPEKDPLGSPDGFTSFDAVTLTLTFDLPSQPGMLNFDWKYGTEENPTFLESVFQDYYRADVGTSTGFTNIALLPAMPTPLPATVYNASPFSNNPLGSSFAPLPPFPTPNDVVYNSVTRNTQTASTDLTPFGKETITLAHRVADASDSGYDTAAFIDNLVIDGCLTQVFVIDEDEVDDAIEELIEASVGSWLTLTSGESDEPAFYRLPTATSPAIVEAVIEGVPEEQTITAIPLNTPEAIKSQTGRVVCGAVYDDVEREDPKTVELEELEANVAFRIIAFTIVGDDDEDLPAIEVEVLDVDTVCSTPLGNVH